MRGEVNNGKRNENKKQETELVPPRRGEDQGSLFRIKAGDMAHVPDGFEDHGVVLVIVFVFLVVVTGVDFGLAALLELIS